MENIPDFFSLVYRLKKDTQHALWYQINKTVLSLLRDTSTKCAKKVEPKIFHSVS